MAKEVKRIEKDPATGTDIEITELVELDDDGNVDKVIEIVDIQPV